MEVEFPFQNIMKITNFKKMNLCPSLLEEICVDHCEMSYLGQIN